MKSTLLLLGACIAGLLCAQAALAGGHNQSREPAIAKDQALTAEIDAALNEYEALWDKQDPAGLIAMWDPGRPGAVLPGRGAGRVGALAGTS